MRIRTEAQKEQARQRAREWRAANPERSRAAVHAYYESHKQWSLENHRTRAAANAERERERRRRDPIGTSQSAARSHAKKPAYYRRLHAASQARRLTRRAGGGGSYTVSEWLDKVALLGGCCIYCGRNDVKLQADHKVPISRGGSSNIGNIVPACRPCNQRKGQRTAHEFLAAEAA